ncbi:hypothetical protein [Spiroplasma endosymbiont of Polydrusus formosus]|uniref:hypothetical protein n=1 Tax=Spiroplasma endosymbiont of Polydrusus formosus TaxID=3139326 RepID=UPI0035B54249
MWDYQQIKTAQEAFANDPLTGQVFKKSAFKDMFTGLLFITNKNNIKNTTDTLPFVIYLLGRIIRLENMEKWLWKLLIYIKNMGKKLK